MKVFHTVVAGVACLALVTGDKSFKPSTEQKKKIKTVANFGNVGGKIEMCPSGDCENGQVIRVSMNRLEEFTAAGVTADNKAENIHAAEFEWSEFAEEDFNGTNVTSTSYMSTLDVGSSTVDLNVTACVFEEKGVGMNGNQTVPVAAGGVKFSINMGSWPFKNTANHLRFGMTLSARDNDNEERKTATMGPHQEVDGLKRVDLSQGMFVDVPTSAIVDGVDTDIVSTVTVTGGKIELMWKFPHYSDDLFYDPVLGSDDPSASISAGSTGGSGTSGSGSETNSDSGTGTGSGSGKTTPTPTTATPAATTVAPTPAPTPTKSSGSVLTVSLSAVMTSVAAVAYYFN